MRTLILAFNRLVSVASLDGANVATAARYATSATAAKCKYNVPTSLDAWVGATFSRATSASFDELRAEMSRWARMNDDRYDLIVPVCDLLLLNSVTELGVRRDVEIPPAVRGAALALLGHELRRHDCEICAAAENGDWTRAIRLAAGREAESAVGALVDAYHAARRAGFVTAVLPVSDVDARYQAGSSSPSITSDGEDVF